MRILLVILFSIVSMLSLDAKCAHYKIDSAKSKIGFNVRHFGIHNVDGNFAKFEGEFDFDPKNLSASSATAKIQADSFNTGIRARDDHMKRIFNAKDFPQISFKSTGGARQNSKGGFDINGELTIRDITKPITLHIVQVKSSSNESDRLAFKAYAFVIRKDFKITWSDIVEQSNSVEQTVNVNLMIEGTSTAGSDSNETSIDLEEL
ncbi:MAG: YceI family protein [Candidatus Caenarcaniphilales bacterium]|nr:YceI family protein [Candidatus Caenarcaniphilales bacterium]